MALSGRRAGLLASMTALGLLDLSCDGMAMSI